MFGEDLFLRIETRVFNDYFGFYPTSFYRLGKKIVFHQIPDFHQKYSNFEILDVSANPLEQDSFYSSLSSIDLQAYLH
jgi:hypothetical protein